MKIGIIGAINQEIKTLKNMMFPYTKKKIGNCKIYISIFKKNNIFLVKSGIGKVSSSIACMILINLYKIDIIINSGSAGSLITSLNVGDIVIPKKICYHDVNLTNFGYSLGQIPKYPQNFLIKKDIYIYIKNITKKIKLTFNTGLIISGDTFINNNLSIKKLKNQFPSAVAVDMESAAIAQVCYQFTIPLICIKTISDLSDVNATVNFKKNISTASFRSFQIVKIILENIVKI
ncbi:5'-methylthioadenosine nucleosidase [Buchnera aphidicola (Diuraphis noxia)]|uniref:adenosylhomocysteine nucleosidase n=1 Tax=Buchnera aphidicola subsp. Diuraphis noxia TaxID=118101 RepID=A0A1B2H876_BUCDN|nr:5'-methylthioadenosine/adenosylhomocysteine nucleosidase [Buchnera aphidicola]ANZ22437.1 5'-methylthioadenosine nucleosidase [Buchnera aphidicola (Diuraphis noxia)]